MASEARKSFDENLGDIESLIGFYNISEQLHEDYPEDGMMKGADVLLRSAIVLLVTYWEAYLEDIVSEALEHIIEHVEDPKKIPKELKKIVSKELVDNKNEIAVWNLAGDGWRACLRSRLPHLTASRNKNFNTPKAEQTREFIKSALGISDITNCWDFNDKDKASNSKFLDLIVTIRGQIAHRGKIEEDIDIKVLKVMTKFVKLLVSRTGGTINAEVKKVTGKPLWTKNG